MDSLNRTYYARHERLDSINCRRAKKTPPSLGKEIRILTHQNRVEEQELKNRMMEAMLMA